MSFPVGYGFDSQAVTRLRTLYGTDLERMSHLDLLAILNALTEGTYQFQRHGESESLGTIATRFQQHTFDDPQVPEILDALDAELNDVSQAVAIIDLFAHWVSVHMGGRG